jgi:hypothetical protein
LPIKESIKLSLVNGLEPWVNLSTDSIERVSINISTYFRENNVVSSTFSISNRNFSILIVENGFIFLHLIFANDNIVFYYV